jgi:hypothetical protein
LRRLILREAIYTRCEDFKLRPLKVDERGSAPAIPYDEDSPP